MQQIDGALSFFGRVIFTQFIGLAQSVHPINESVNEKAVLQIFVDFAESSSPVVLRDESASRGVSKSIPGFDAMQGSEKQRFSHALHAGACFCAV